MEFECSICMGSGSVGGATCRCIGGEGGVMDEYDVGLLSDWGGGNVAWWHDYLRYEIGCANSHWIQQTESLSAELAECKRDAEELSRLRTLYAELLMAVGNKHVGETRHETALRYIHEAETTGHASAQSDAALAAKGE